MKAGVHRGMAAADRKRRREIMENTRPKRPIAGFAVIIVLALAVYALSFVEFPGTSLLQDYGS